MSIQQRVLLRHRTEGHLRFSLPSILCAPGVGERLVAGLRAMEGVYRVDLYRGQGKLSIRYLDTVCDFAAVVRRLHALLGDLTGKAGGAPSAPKAKASPGLPQLAESRPARWLREKLKEARETAAALGIVAKQAFRTVGRRPRWLQDFLNDLLMLFLIKLHWHHITTLWLPNPWRYRYEWLATFYLIYLQVQSRLPQRV